MYTEQIKKKTANKFRNVIRSDEVNVQTNLLILMKFLNENLITASILDELRSTEVYKTGWEPKTSRGIGPSIRDPNLPPNDMDRAAVILSILEDCVENPRQLVNIGLNMHNTRNFDAATKYFNQTFTKIFYEYIIERFEEGNLILYLLNRFKARCEWFFKSELLDLYVNNTSHGEKLLTKELRKFLFDQGVDYPFSEPETPSGKPDLIYGIGGKNPLTLEIKLFNPPKYGTAYIKKGFRQAFDYAEDYNQPFGYLLIFNLSEYNIKFRTKNSFKPVQIEFGDKTIFIIIVNLFNDGKSSSQRKKLEPFEIDEKELKT